MEKNEIRIWFDADKIYIEERDRGIASLPLNRFPRLMYASEDERNNYEISPFGIHWPQLDEDLSFDGFYEPHTKYQQIS